MIKKFGDYIKESYDDDEGYYIVLGGVKLYYSQDGMHYLCTKEGWSANNTFAKPFTRVERINIKKAMDNIIDENISYMLESDNLLISFNETRHILMDYVELLSKNDYTDL